MNPSGFDLNLLVVFNAIYAEESLTHAGEALHLTQPAISHALNRLRSTFDDQLFVRDGNRMKPTPLAEELRPDVQKMLELAENTLADRGEFDPTRSTRTFHIGIQDYPMLVVLPHLIRKIQQSGYTINIKTSHLNKEDRKTALEKGQLDMVIGVRQKYGSNIMQQYLYSDYEVCIARNDHPAIKDTLSLDQYINSEFIGLSVSEYEDQAIDKEMKKLGHERNIRLNVENEVMIPQLVAKSDLLANVAVQVAKNFAEWLPIKTLPIPVSNTAFKFYQYWHIRHQKDPAHLWLRKTIKSLCREIEHIES